MMTASQTRQSGPERVTKLLNRLVFQVSRARRSGDAETVHDLRVSIRRFNQALVIFKPCFDRRQVKKIRRCLRKIMVVAGEVRDCDIALEYLSGQRSHELAGIEGELQRSRRRVSGRLLVALEDWVRRKTSSKWRTALQPVDHAEELPCYDLRAAAPEATRKIAKEFFRSGDRSSAAGASAAELHHVRIVAKKFRYTLELFAPCYGPAVAGWLDRMATLQSVLGRINDCRTVRRILAAYGGHKKVEAALKRRQHRRTADFQKLWAGEFSSAAKAWMHSLESPPRKPAGRASAAQVKRMAAGA